MKLKYTFLSFATTIWLVVSFGSAIGLRTYNNPVITGMNPNPGICRVDDDF